MIRLGIDQLDRQAHINELRWMIRSARTPRLRTYRQFAEQEIQLPNTGPKAGRTYSCSFQPFTALWFDAIGSGLFNRFAATGCSQSGKTLSCFVIPILYHLFEKRENVIGFSPGDDINEQKWLLDILPVIQKSQYANLLPKRGGGSQGGFDHLIRFGNGTYLNWKTGGGGDKNKSAITAKVACGTEINGMKSSAESVESTPLKQIAARLRSHGSRALMFLECTVDEPDGAITQEIENGTCSKIVRPCPHCSAWVTPEREHFMGWDGAATELEAERRGQFFCPDCGQGWTQEQRRAVNAKSKLLHKGQTITVGGEIIGPVPETRTFGFRWSAVDNNFAEESQIGLEEWKAARNPDRDDAEKERCQFVWVVPFTGEQSGAEVDEDLIASRLTGIPQNRVPDAYETLVCKVDIHNRHHFWTVMATEPGRVRSIVQYGITPTPFAGGESPQEAIRIGLELVKSELEGIQFRTQSGKVVEIDLHGVDCGYEQDVAVEFCRKAGPKWIPMKGMGKDYKEQKQRTADIRPGEHYYQSRQPATKASGYKKWWLTISQTRHWMKETHGGFKAETFVENGQRRPGSIALFGADPQVHLTLVDRTVSRSAYATQLVAWKWEIPKVKGGATGVTCDWIGQYSKDGRDDHFFDTTYDCLVLDSLARETVLKAKFAKKLTGKTESTAVPSPQHFRFFSSGERPRLS